MIWAIISARLSTTKRPYRVQTLFSTIIVPLASKGVAADSLGDHLQAMKFFSQALKINPNDLYANDGMGSALISLKNYREAIYYYDRVLASDPSHEVALIGKGLALSYVGNNPGSLYYLDKALVQRPNDYALLMIRDLCSLQLGTIHRLWPSLMQL